ncbi:hypothetical protein [Aeromonas salmonicida]|uniref:hypothetical protein n=1 Tax=Aeromonas salmonicida TaxID=645 RepID=UPI00232C344E|nr:hypothetical protein [Aeromonas salmonicida]WCH25172.1 hypothetical protein ONZ54_23180 [Aeromonas salmonicida]
MAFEVQYLMELDESGVITLESDEAQANNVTEWLDTPKGHVYGRPSWGNELALFKHEPPTDDTAVALENSILIGMQADLPSIQVTGIFCEPSATEIDKYRVRILTQEGYIDAVYKL